MQHRATRVQLGLRIALLQIANQLGFIVAQQHRCNTLGRGRHQNLPERTRTHGVVQNQGSGG